MPKTLKKGKDNNPLAAVLEGRAAEVITPVLRSDIEIRLKPKPVNLELENSAGAVKGFRANEAGLLKTGNKIALQQYKNTKLSMDTSMSASGRQAHLNYIKKSLDLNDKTMQPKYGGEANIMPNKTPIDPKKFRRPINDPIYQQPELPSTSKTVSPITEKVKEVKQTNLHKRGLETEVKAATKSPRTVKLAEGEGAVKDFNIQKTGLQIEADKGRRSALREAGAQASKDQAAKSATELTKANTAASEIEAAGIAEKAQKAKQLMKSPRNVSLAGDEGAVKGFNIQKTGLDIATDKEKRTSLREGVAKARAAVKPVEVAAPAEKGFLGRMGSKIAKKAAYEFNELKPSTIAGKVSKFGADTGKAMEVAKDTAKAARFFNVIAKTAPARVALRAAGEVASKVAAPLILADTGNFAYQSARYGLTEGGGVENFLKAKDAGDDFDAEARIAKARGIVTKKRGMLKSSINEAAKTVDSFINFGLGSDKPDIEVSVPDEKKAMDIANETRKKKRAQDLSGMSMSDLSNLEIRSKK